MVHRALSRGFLVDNELLAHNRCQFYELAAAHGLLRLMNQKKGDWTE
jgi:hypothetical protein